MTSSAIETSLMLSIEQIIEGDQGCAYCDEPATLTVATGADPDPESVCATHALPHLDVTRNVITSLFG